MTVRGEGFAEPAELEVTVGGIRCKEVEVRILKRRGKSGEIITPAKGEEIDVLAPP